MGYLTVHFVEVVLSPEYGQDFKRRQRGLPDAALGAKRSRDTGKSSGCALVSAAPAAATAAEHLRQRTHSGADIAPRVADQHRLPAP